MALPAQGLVFCGEPSVVRAHCVYGDGGAHVEFKLTWTLTGSLRGIFDKKSGEVDNAAVGLLGKGSWHMRVDGNGIGTSAEFWLGVKYTGEYKASLAPKTTWKAVVSSTSTPNVQLATDGDRNLYEDWDTSRKEYRQLAPAFENGGTVAVQVTVTIADLQFIAAAVASIEEEKLGMAQQGECMKQFYLAGSFTDAVLIAADGQEIPVHRTVLAARSEVFAAMFTHDTAEKKTGRVDITDITFDTLKVFTDALYGLDVADRLSIEVYVAADKYQVLELKERCVKRLKSTVNLANAFERFMFARGNDQEDVAVAMCAFVKDNFFAFVESGGLKEVHKKRNKTYCRDFLLLSCPQQGQKRDADAAGL